MADMSAVGALWASFNGIKTIGEGLLAVRDISAIGTKVTELNAKIIEAQNGVFTIQQERAALVDRVSALEKEIADMRAWDTEKERYELTAVAPNVFAYSVKPSAQNGEPPHRICERCYQNSKKSILQSNNGSPTETIHCNGCGSDIIIRHHRPTPIVTGTSSRGRDGWMGR